MYDGIGVAVVGTGFMGRSHVDALRRLGVRVVGVLGSSEAKSCSARELVRIARDSGLHAGVNYNIRFYPLNLHARRMVESGAIGSIHSIWGGYVQDWLLYDTDYNWRVLADRGGALRAVSDIGTHC